MALKDDLATDMVETFADSNEFGREIVYIPGGVEASKRTIKAVVDWGDDVEASPILTDVGGGRSLVHVTVANHATSGVDKPNVAKDRFELPRLLEESVARFKIHRILGQDEGVWDLLLGASN